MSYVQAVTPNPNIPCQPGWCLQYVRQAFNLPAKYGSATEAWEKSTSQHRDRNFPPNVWHPVWYGLDKEPAGHVVLRAPDGSVYSTSDLGSTPHHHTDLADLEAYYAYYGMTLTYRGWTEDVASYPVITNNMSIAFEGAVTPQEDTLSAAEVQEIKDHINAVLIGGYTWKDGRHYGIAPILEQVQRQVAGTPAAVWATPVKRAGGSVSALQELADVKSKVIGIEPVIAQIQDQTDPATLAGLIPDAIAQQVIDALAARLAGGAD